MYIYNMLDPPSRPAHHGYLVRLVGIAPSLQEEVAIVVKQAGASLVVDSIVSLVRTVVQLPRHHHHHHTLYYYNN